MTYGWMQIIYVILFLISILMSQFEVKVYAFIRLMKNISPHYSYPFQCSTNRFKAYSLIIHLKTLKYGHIICQVFIQLTMFFGFPNTSLCTLLAKNVELVPTLYSTPCPMYNAIWEACCSLKMLLLIFRISLFSSLIVFYESLLVWWFNLQCWLHEYYSRVCFLFPWSFYLFPINFI